MDATKPPRPDAILKNLPESFQEELWLMRHPAEGEDGEKPASITAEAARAWLKSEHGISVSAGSFSDWEHWYRLRAEINRARATAEQTRLKMAEDPNFSSEDIERVGQVVFANQMLESGNVKAFIALAKLNLARQSVRQQQEMLAQRDRTIEQRDEVIRQNERRIELLERKAAERDAAAAELQKLRTGGKLLPEEEREAILSRMDEVLGIKRPGE
jgi:hypothetical protein